MHIKAIIKTGYTCNNNCVFCHSSEKRGFKDLSFVKLKEKIDILKNQGIDCLLLSGGEPTIRKDIFKILGYAKKQNLIIGLVTNARMLSLPSFLDRLSYFNVKYCYTSLHSSKEENHNKITRSDSFNQTVEGIKNAVKGNIDVFVNVVILRDNLEDIGDTVDFLKALKVRKIKLSFVEPLMECGKTSVPDIVDAANGVKSVLEKNAGNPCIGWDGFPLCLMSGHEERQINLKTECISHISEVWEKELFPSDEGNKEKIKKCDYCKRGNVCEGIYSQYLNRHPEIKWAITPYTDEQPDFEIYKDKNKGGEIRLVLLAARACCLSCKYCFVKKTNELMSETTIKKSIDFLLSSNKINVQLQFFGGEPLMLPDDVLKRSIVYAIKEARINRKNIKIIITTNSVYLNEDKIKFLEKYKKNIIIEVSLDGDKESQNINRPQNNGANLDSYGIITKNFPRLIKSTLDYRISMVVSPQTCGKLLYNFEHLLNLGFRKIWIMLSCGVFWKNEDIEIFQTQLEMIGKKYYDDIKNRKIIILNLRDWFVPYRMNTELIIDLNEKIYPACMNYLIDSSAVKEEFCLGDLNKLGGKNIDYYEKLRISNDHSINIFFKENKIIPNYSGNIKTGIMINTFIKNVLLKLKADGIEIQDIFSGI